MRRFLAMDMISFLCVAQSGSCIRRGAMSFVAQSMCRIDLLCTPSLFILGMLTRYHIQHNKLWTWVLYSGFCSSVFWVLCPVPFTKFSSGPGQCLWSVSCQCHLKIISIIDITIIYIFLKQASQLAPFRIQIWRCC